MKRNLFVLLCALSAIVRTTHVQAQAAPPSAGDRPTITRSAAQRSAGTRSVEGRVRRPVGKSGDSTGMGPAVGAMVTLHRVGKDSAGPVDSVRSDAQGRYRISWKPFGSDDAVYFAAVSWDGIAYFTAPLKDTNARGDDAEITVFDTTMRTFPLAVKGRHLIVSKIDSANLRTVIEVFELGNDSVKTLVTADGKSSIPTWTVAVPEAAQDVRVTQGEVSAEAFAYARGRVSIFAPVAPGLKQVSFTYKLPVASFPIAVRAEQGAVVFEVLLEDQAGNVFGSGFTNVAPVTIETRTFKRFLAQDVKAGNIVTIELPTSTTSKKTIYTVALLVAVGFLMLLVLQRSMQRRSQQDIGALAAPGALRTIRASRIPEAPLQDRLAQEIAALDATFARTVAPSDAVRHAYTNRRRELKQALAEAMGEPFVDDPVAPTSTDAPLASDPNAR